MNSVSPFRVHGALFLVNLIYAANYTIDKEVMPAYIGPSGFILVRISGSLLLLLLYNGLFIREKIKGAKDFLTLILCAFFGVSLNMLMFFEGLSRTSPINAALIMVTTPILVLLIGIILKMERLTVLKTIGVALGLTGAMLLIKDTSHVVKSASLEGDLMILLNAASYGVYLVIVRPLMQKYNPITIIMWTFIFGLLMVLPFGWSEMVHARWADLTPVLWLNVSFVVIATTFIAYTLNAWALRHVKSSVVGSYVYLQPVLGTFIALASSKYGLYWQQVVYAMLIFAGIYLVSVNKQWIPRKQRNN